jgi:ketosteroid isomerase-like protein
MLTHETVQKVFSPLESSDSQTFFTHVSPTCAWTITGHSHPLAGHHDKSSVIKNALNRIGGCMATPIKRQVTGILVSGDWATVEHTAEATTKVGGRYWQEFCWVCRFEGDVIVELRMYMDSAHARDVIEANEGK